MEIKNFLISLRQYINNIDICNEIKSYKNIHKGQRCFIIGTGPSLTADDLNKLKNEVTFGSNRIFEIFSQTDWRPTYYMNQDYKLICKYVDEIKEIKARRKFMPIEAMNFFEG